MRAQRRIGVSIQIPEPFASQLVQTRFAVGDPQAAAVPAHVTLLGPTVIDDTQWQTVIDHLAAAAQVTAPFTMRLRGTGTFRPVSQVVFVQVAAGIGQCERLESAIRSGCLAQPLRFHYHPHVTVAHDVAPAALDRAEQLLAGFEASFAVSEFHLYDHGDDGVWRSVQRFALGGKVSNTHQRSAAN